jgi:hypothetical protein
MKVSRKVGRRKHSRSSSISRRRLRNKKSRSGYRKRHAKTQRGGARSRKYGDKRGKRFHRGGTYFRLPSFITKNQDMLRVGTFNFITTCDVEGAVEEENTYDVYYDKMSGKPPNIVLLRRGKDDTYDVIFNMNNEYSGWVDVDTGMTEPDLLNPKGPPIPIMRSVKRVNMGRYTNMMADPPVALEAKGQEIKIKNALLSFSDEYIPSGDSIMYNFPVCTLNEKSMKEIYNFIK